MSYELNDERMQADGGPETEGCFSCGRDVMSVNAAGECTRCARESRGTSRGYRICQSERFMSTPMGEI